MPSLTFNGRVCVKKEVPGAADLFGNLGIDLIVARTISVEIH